MKKINSVIAIFVIISMFVCGCSNEDSVSTSEEVLLAQVAVQEDKLEDDSDVSEEKPLHMTDIQLNSICMLNYLAGITQEINAKKNSRLYIEDVYSILLNNMNPNTVDEKTQDQLIFLMETLNNYRMISVKRDRLQFIFEQNRAQAIRDAVPNPRDIIKGIDTKDWVKTAISVAAIAIDSYAEYKSSTAQAELQFIQDGWELDDEEQTVLHNINMETFSYLNNTVRDHNLPGNLALNDEAITTFVSWKKISNVAQRIRLLESNQNKYKAYGEYWLLLAESYYKHGDYQKCLDAISSYESLKIQIFRDDIGYARILPLAVVSAKEIYTNDEYIQYADRCGNSIISNTDDNYEWALCYFAAQTYMDLYAQSGNRDFLVKAYNIVLDNISRLIDKQKEDNSTYISEVVVQEIPKDATEAEKKDIENYNKQIKEDRKRELPPIYEPLLLNCELLYSLADEMQIGDEQRNNIDEILHEKGNIIFLVPTLNMRYTFSNNNETSVDSDIDVLFNGKELSIPAKYVTDNAIIKMTVTTPESAEPYIINDWVLTDVKRSVNNDIDSFKASFRSDEAGQYKYMLDSCIKIEIFAHEGVETQPITLEYETVNTKTDLLKNIAFWNSNIGFRRVK